MDIPESSLGADSLLLAMAVMAGNKIRHRQIKDVRYIMTLLGEQTVP
jgi:hypothetical protein